ncbi:MAG: GC-type dockerin domain-anchored protein [Planctomycetota bacterium]
MRILTLLCALAAAAPAALGQLSADGIRIATWNITFYDGGLEDELRTVLYGVFDGRAMMPDAIVVQEFQNRAAYDDFLAAINSAPGSPGDWAASQFRDGTGFDTHLFFRVSKLVLTEVTVVSEGGPNPNHPRDPMRYDLRPWGYSDEAAGFSLYSVHFKAGSSPTDQSRRLVEARAIREDAAALPEGRGVILAGDFNIQRASQAAYQELIGTAPSSDPFDTGRFFDPISQIGDWQNNPSFRFVHTQDPAPGAAGMDDRYDQLLVSEDLVDGESLDYIGRFGIPYSNATWNDPNHSYRAWGNDGSSYNQALRTVGNTMVGPDIAQAIRVAANGAGHVPVYLDLRVPAVIDAPATVDAGAVRPGQTIGVPIEHGGSINRWGIDGIDTLRATANSGPNIMPELGPFEIPAGQSVLVPVTVTSEPGELDAELHLASNDPERPVITVRIVGTVLEPCGADVNSDGVADGSDFFAWVAAFGAQAPECDVNSDGSCNGGDFFAWVAFFNKGC